MPCKGPLGSGPRGLTVVGIIQLLIPSPRELPTNISNLGFMGKEILLL